MAYVTLSTTDSWEVKTVHAGLIVTDNVGANKLSLYKKWCHSTKSKNYRKHYWLYIQKDGGRDEIRDELAETIRSHYDRLENIAEDVKRLGYRKTSKILSAVMPQTDKSRSGDLGEILATELIEEETNLRVPVRRLRYKDGRDMAMRGDDFIGVGFDGVKLRLLKGEAKSNKMLSKTTVTSARHMPIEVSLSRQAMLSKIYAATILTQKFSAGYPQQIGMAEIVWRFLRKNHLTTSFLLAN